MTSCSDDRDSNPTLLQPTEFKLNAPSVANGTVDLSRTEGSNYGRPATWRHPSPKPYSSSMYGRKMLFRERWNSASV